MYTKFYGKSGGIVTNLSTKLWLLEKNAFPTTFLCHPFLAHRSIHNCRDHAHTRPPLAQITVRGEKKFGHSTLYRKCIAKTQWCADKPINYSPQKISKRSTNRIHLNVHSYVYFKIHQNISCSILYLVSFKVFCG